MPGVASAAGSGSGRSGGTRLRSITSRSEQNGAQKGDREAAIDAEIERVNNLPAHSSYAIHRMKELNKLRHLSIKFCSAPLGRYVAAQTLLLSILEPRRNVSLYFLSLFARSAGVRKSTTRQPDAFFSSDCKKISVKLRELVPAKHQQCWFRILLLQDQ